MSYLQLIYDYPSMIRLHAQLTCPKLDEKSKIWFVSKLGKFLNDVRILIEMTLI